MFKLIPDTMEKHVEVQSISNTNKHTLVHINTKKRVCITLQFALEKGTIRPLWEAWRVIHTRIRRLTNPSSPTGCPTG